jgi:plastocyanin
VCDVDITVPGEDYPKLIEIDPGTSIRFTNRVTKNNAEHTITPVKTSNAVNYFGGLSFYASDLGGLYTLTQVICGNVNCMDAFAVQRDPKSPFLTINWPEADYPYFCQFHGGQEKGIIRVGNGAFSENDKRILSFTLTNNNINRGAADSTKHRS